MEGGNGRTKKAMWLYPKLSAFNPPFSERWGHSACFFDRSLYVFGVPTYIPTYNPSHSFYLLS